MTKLKPKTVRPPDPSPNAFRNLDQEKTRTATPAVVESALAKLQNIPGPAALPVTDAEKDKVIARMAPVVARPRRKQPSRLARFGKLVGVALVRSLVVTVGPAEVAVIVAWTLAVFYVSITRAVPALQNWLG